MREAMLVAARRLSPEVRELTIDPGADFRFVAGQWVSFRIPVQGQIAARAYSIASPPNDNNRVELEIRLVPNGICTTYVHKFLKEGDEVTINGPYGDFYLRNSERNIICIAGGSGMAPIKSILLDMVDKGIDRKTMYFFGARSKRDLFLLDEMRELEQRLPNFTFVPALSEPAPEDNWEGEVGLITDVVRRMVKDGPNSEAYLCGSPGMINACMTVLTELNVAEENIFYDKFS